MALNIGGGLKANLGTDAAAEVIILATVEGSEQSIQHRMDPRSAIHWATSVIEAANLVMHDESLFRMWASENPDDHLQARIENAQRKHKQLIEFRAQAGPPVAKAEPLVIVPNEVG